MNLFDILGPVMVGPSSSHTAGAVKIGYIAAKLLQDVPVLTEITLHGSFATTGVGHGTDKALIAGILGMKADNMQIPDSFSIAKENKLSFTFKAEKLKDAHPNTAIIRLQGKEGKELEMQAASIGGGRIMVQKIDGINMNFSAEKPTLIVHNRDQPGHVAEVTSILSQRSVNIASMQLFRNKRGGHAIMVIEMDEPLPLGFIQWSEYLKGLLKVTYINMEERE